MVALDVDCRAVVRTPLACQSWERGQYEALARHGYSPEVGMAQGNVDSTEWAAFFDPLLCSLNMVDDGKYFFQAGGGGIEAAKDTAADDPVSFAGTHEALQAKLAWSRPSV